MRWALNSLVALKASGRCALEVYVKQSIWNSSYLAVPAVFAGILGVIGMFEDVRIVLGREVSDEQGIYLKYYAAALGALGHAIMVYKRSRSGRST